MRRNGKKTLTLEACTGGVVIVWMDDPDDAVNTLKRGLAEEFDRVLSELAARDDLKAMVFASAKPESFLVGADLDMLQAVKTVADATALSRLSQRIQNRLAGLAVPTVAAIHGACLGGRLELALAFEARIASDDAQTQLGFPEVQLGLLPGGGGTQRLPRRVGVQVALDLLLTGKSLPAARAREIGLVDEVVPEPILVEVALQLALQLANQTKPSESRAFLRKLKKLFSVAGLREFVLTKNPIGRRLLFDQARQQILKKTRGHYPAPQRILEVVRKGLEQGLEAGLEAEAQAFGELAVSGEARELINLFFATSALKKDRGIDDPMVDARPVKKIGVLGGGLMGAGITSVTVLQTKIPVRLKDKDDAGVGRALAYVHQRLDERVARRRMTPLECNQVLARCSGTIDYSGFADADVVIEAVFEDLALKQQTVKDIEACGKREVIFASNTSAIPIHKIAAASAHPETVIGLHYFSPVEKMPLLEIIVTEKTAAWVTATCVALGKQQGKIVIVARDGAGFYTTRILAPYLNEAVYLLSEGIPIEAIDAALVDFGFPVGPLTLLDEVGIDVDEKVARTVHEAFGERMQVPPGTQKLVADQRLGRKNKRGFYLYEGKRQKGAKLIDKSIYGVLGVEPKAARSAAEITERCVLQMVNEAAHGFGEGILRSARDGDIGAIFGLGFPAVLGGPFRYVDALGAAHVVRRLTHYVEHHGVRFTPAPALLELAKTGGRFHGSRSWRAGLIASW